MTHPPKERPLRVGPFSGARDKDNDGWWLSRFPPPGGHAIGFVYDHELRDFSRFVLKMQAAETKRKARR